jgi:hypothetical protein
LPKGKDAIRAQSRWRQIGAMWLGHDQRERQDRQEHQGAASDSTGQLTVVRGKESQHRRRV